MHINYGTYMRQSNNDGHSDDNSSDETHVTVDPQQDNAGVNNPICLDWEDNTETKNVNMSQSKLGSRL